MTVKRKSGMTPKQWYEPKTEMGWKKSQGMEIRRRKALRAHKGNRLSTARALGALANVTTDKVTERLARADSKYFYAEHRKGKD